MTHLLDRHCTADSFKAAVSRRIASGPPPSGQPTQPVTMIKNPAAVATQPENIAGSASPALSTSSSGSMGAGSAALQAIKRHTLDFQREMMVRIEITIPRHSVRDLHKESPFSFQFISGR